MICLMEGQGRGQKQIVQVRTSVFGEDEAATVKWVVSHAQEYAAGMSKEDLHKSKAEIAARTPAQATSLALL